MEVGKVVVGWWGPVVLELGCWRDAANWHSLHQPQVSLHTPGTRETSANTAHCTVGNSEGTGTIVHSGKMEFFCSVSPSVCVDTESWYSFEH